MKKIIAVLALALTGFLGSATAASAVPIDPSPGHVARTWSPTRPTRLGFSPCSRPQSRACFEAQARQRAIHRGYIPAPVRQPR